MCVQALSNGITHTAFWWLLIFLSHTYLCHSFIGQALTLAMCPLARMPFWGCRASSGHHNLFSTGPRGQWFSFTFFFFFFFFLVLHMLPLFLLGISKTRKATLIRIHFSLYIGLMYKSVQLHAWNHKFPPRKHLGHYMFWGGGAVGFLGGQWIFWFTGPPGQWLPQSNVKACIGTVLN